MHFARHLRNERLGEFTIGTELHRSDTLGLVQLLILYHLVTARAVVSLGGGSARDFDLSALEQLVANEEASRSRSPRCRSRSRATSGWCSPRRSCR